jgi:hypothetical protein
MMPKTSVLEIAKSEIKLMRAENNRIKIIDGSGFIFMINTSCSEAISADEPINVSSNQEITSLLILCINRLVSYADKRLKNDPEISSACNKKCRPNSETALPFEPGKDSMHALCRKPAFSVERGHAA